jgi:hypothetical protein
MPKLRIAIMLLGATAFAQESLSPLSSPIESPSPSPLPAATSSPSSHTVSLRFVPPPMEGTISLGIWDANDKLVRVLHREAKVDKFTVEENSLSTTWDGKNDAGEDLPAGKYRARGYLVGNLKVEIVSESLTSAMINSALDHVSVALVTNPLSSDVRSVMDLGVGVDPKGSFLRTMDNLPLYTVSATPNIVRVAILKDGASSATVAEESDKLRHFRVSNIDKMIAFDCGFFELK